MRERKIKKEEKKRGRKNRIPLPIVFGLNAASTSSSSHPFQYSLEMARSGGL